MDGGGGIPKVIYSFWDSDQLPEIVRLCVQSWRRHNPDYRIVMLSAATAVPYLPAVPHPPGQHCWQHYADLLRLELLAKHGGGFWLDASLFLTAPLDWVQEVARDKNFVGFTLGPRNRSTLSLENWFLACKPGCRFMALWHEDFAPFRDAPSIEAFADARLQLVENIWTNPYYLVAYISAAVVMKRRMKPDERRNTLALFKAESGPLALLTQQRGHSDLRFLKALPKHTESFADWKMIKFTGRHRAILDDDLTAKQRNAVYQTLSDAIP